MNISEQKREYRQDALLKISMTHTLGYYLIILGCYAITPGDKGSSFTILTSILGVLNAILFLMAVFYKKDLSNKTKLRLEKTYYYLTTTIALTMGLLTINQGEVHGFLSTPHLGAWVFLVGAIESYASFLYTTPRFFILILLCLNLPTAIWLMTLNTQVAWVLTFIVVTYTPIIVYRVRRLTGLLHQNFENIEQVLNQRHQLQIFIDSLPSKISWIDSNLNYKAINKRLKHSIGGIDIIGEPVGSRDNQSQLVDEINNFFNSKEESKSVEILLHTDEGPRWHLSNFRQHNFGKGKELFIISLDIHNERMLKEDLEVQKSLADQSLRLANLGRMASGVAHEINNPLAIAEATLALIQSKRKRGTLSEEDLKDKFDKISNAHDRIANVIEGMSTFSQKETPREYEIFEVMELIKEIKKNLNEKMINHEIHFYIDVIPRELTYFASKNEISIILTNFIDNAIDAIKESMPSLKEINASAKVNEKTNNLEIKVSDTANSLKEDFENILVPFYSTKTDSKILGMGLSLSRYIANLYGGEISVSSENERTIFTLSLPIEKVD